MSSESKFSDVRQLILDDIMAKQIQSLTIMNVKSEQTERVKMEISSIEKNNPTIEALLELIEDPSPDENDKAIHIYKRIYINYGKKLDHKCKFQQYYHETRIILMELSNNNDMNDNDEHEHEQFFLSINSKNIDDLINGQLTSKSNKKLKKKL